MGIFPKPKKEVDRKLLLIKVALSKLSYLEKKKFTKSTIEDLNWILKVFFKNYFGIKGEVTYTELIEKIDSRLIDEDVKRRIGDLFNFFIGAKYKSIKYTSKDVREKLEEGKNIIKCLHELSSSPMFEEEHHLFGRIAGFTDSIIQKRLELKEKAEVQRLRDVEKQRKKYMRSEKKLALKEARQKKREEERKFKEKHSQEAADGELKGVKTEPGKLIVGIPHASERQDSLAQGEKIMAHQEQIKRKQEQIRFIEERMIQRQEELRQRELERLQKEEMKIRQINEKRWEKGIQLFLGKEDEEAKKDLLITQRQEELERLKADKNRLEAQKNEISMGLYTPRDTGISKLLNQKISDLVRCSKNRPNQGLLIDDDHFDQEFSRQDSKKFDEKSIEALQRAKLDAQEGKVRQSLDNVEQKQQQWLEQQTMIIAIRKQQEQLKADRLRLENQLNAEKEAERSLRNEHTKQDWLDKQRFLLDKKKHEEELKKDRLRLRNLLKVEEEKSTEHKKQDWLDVQKFLLDKKEHEEELKKDRLRLRSLIKAQREAERNRRDEQKKQDWLDNQRFLLDKKKHEEELKKDRLRLENQLKAEKEEKINLKVEEREQKRLERQKEWFAFISSVRHYFKNLRKKEPSEVSDEKDIQIEEPQSIPRSQEQIKKPLSLIKSKDYTPNIAPINHDLKKAKKIYAKIAYLYNTLENTDKVKIYKEIKKLQEDIKETENMVSALL